MSLFPFQTSGFAPRNNIFSRGQKKPKRLKEFDWILFLLCMVALMANLLVFESGCFKRFEAIFLDQFFRERPAVSLDSEILLVDIDEESLRAIGPWPWPASYYARIMRILQTAGARAMVFDRSFLSEEDPEALRELAAAMQAAGNVYFPVELGIRPEKKFWIHTLPVILKPKSEQKVWLHGASELEQSAKGLGHRELEPDSDGVLRRIQTQIFKEGEGFPFLGLQVAVDTLARRELSISKETAGWLEKPQEMLVNWRRVTDSDFPRISCADLVRNQQRGETLGAPDLIRGKICVIGLSALSQAKTVLTPVAQNMPEFEVQVHVLNGVLTGRLLKNIPWQFQMVLLVLVGLAASVFFSVFRNASSLMAGLGFGIFWVVGAYLVFWLQGIWTLVFHPLLLILSLGVVSAIYNQFSAARDSKRLLDLATRDGLTGLYVIRHFRELLNQCVEQAQSTGEALSVIMMDIDNFKAINDTYGHPAGDMVLRETAKMALSCVRSKRPFYQMDLMARYGGEEFIVLLKNAKISDAASKAADRIRKKVESAEFMWKGTRIPVTLSLGVASLQAGEAIPDSMVHRADEALYKAKREGKNRVCTSAISIS